MNIKDLPQGSYTVEEPKKLNINNLPKESYSLDHSMAGLARSQYLSDLTTQTEKAKQEADALGSPLGIATETARGTVGTLFDKTLKVAQSVAQAPADIYHKLTGGSVDTSIKPNFAQTGQRTIQGDLASGGGLGQAAMDVAEGVPIPASLTAKGAGLLERTTLKPAVSLAKGVMEKTGISKFLAERADKKMLNTALDAVTPRTKDLTTTEMEQLLRQKRVTPKTLTSPSKYILSDREKAAATKYKDLFQSKDPVENSTRALERIAVEDADVGDFIDKNNGIFNTGEFKNYIKDQLKDVSDVMIPESRINKLKNDITDNFIKGLPKNDYKSLWINRKEFDQQIESAFSGSPTLQKEVKKKFRNAVQEFLSEKTPDGVYKAKMKDMTDLFDLQDTLATKAIKEKGNNAFQDWIRLHPTEAKIAGLGVTAAGGATIWNVINE